MSHIRTFEICLIMIQHIEVKPINKKWRTGRQNTECSDIDKDAVCDLPLPSSPSTALMVSGSSRKMAKEDGVKQIASALVDQAWDSPLWLNIVGSWQDESYKDLVTPVYIELSSDNQLLFLQRDLFQWFERLKYYNLKEAIIFLAAHVLRLFQLCQVIPQLQKFWKCRGLDVRVSETWTSPSEKISRFCAPGILCA